MAEVSSHMITPIATTYCRAESLCLLALAIVLNMISEVSWSESSVWGARRSVGVERGVAHGCEEEGNGRTDGGQERERGRVAPFGSHANGHRAARRRALTLATPHPSVRTSFRSRDSPTPRRGGPLASSPSLRRPCCRLFSLCCVYERVYEACVRASLCLCLVCLSLFLSTPPKLCLNKKSR